jgi:hypothetical protein
VIEGEVGNREGRHEVATSIFLDTLKEHFEELALGYVTAAARTIMYFNDPENFVVEDRPPEREKKRPKGRIAREHERPTYTVLKPTQIRRRLRLKDPDEEGGTKKRPHERRAHLRTYPDDIVKWPKAHGRTIVVKACWIGPHTAEFNGHRYKVLIDMHPPQLPDVPHMEVDDEQG